MRYRVLTILMVLAMSLAACNLGANDSDLEPTDLPLASATPALGQPGVAIISPVSGEEVVANQSVLVEVSTSGNAESVELFVNGSSVQEVRISDPTSPTSRSVLNFTPRTTGSTTLRVVSYRSNISSVPSEVTINVRQSQSFVTATSAGPVIDPNDPTCRALVNTGLNFRRSPDTNAEVIRVLAAGEILPIVGRLADNSWVQLRSNINIGWVSSSFVTRYGNCTGLVIVVPPTTPTPFPTALPSFTPIPATATPRPSETPSPAPNLIVASISGTQNVVIPSGSSSVTVEYGVVITNIGGSLNQQFTIEAQLLPGGETFDFGVVGGGLGPNQSISLEGSVTYTASGTFALQVTADSDEEITESRENDNSSLINVTVVKQ